MISEKFQILHQLRSLLDYHRLSGVKSYPFSTQVQKFLSVEYQDEQAASTAADRGNTQDTIDIQSRDKYTNKLAAIEEIAEEVRDCRSCSLCQSRVVSVPGVGNSEIKLMIVGGWLTLSQEDKDLVNVFGKEEDLMLARMLEAIHLNRGSVFITNVIKCGIDPSVQPKAENVEVCLSYLHRQIGALSPDIICTMGIIATRAFLKNSRPLSQQRGRFHDYSIEKKRIPLLPTYHPSFLLKNPEMKMATWNDLQLIEKKLTT